MATYNIIKKELKELFRDKKGLFFSILFPVALVLIISAVSAVANIMITINKDNRVEITANFDLKECMKQADKSYLILIEKEDEIYKKVKDGDAKLGVIWKEADRQLIFVENTSNDDINIGIIEENIASVLQLHLLPKNSIPVINTTKSTVSKDYQPIVQKLIAVICSYVIFLLTIRLNGSIAYYLTVKEKIYGTFEILLLTPVKTRSIVLAKWITNFLMSFMMSVIIAIPLYTASILLFDFALKVDLNLIVKIPFLLIELMCFSAVFSIFQLALGFLPRNSRQTNAFIGYAAWFFTILLSIIVGLDFKSLNSYISNVYWVDFIPIINLYDIIQMTILSTFNGTKVFLAISINLLVIVGCFLLLVKTLKNEKTLFFKF